MTCTSLCFRPSSSDRVIERAKELLTFVEKGSVGTWGGVHQWCVKNVKQQVSIALLAKGEQFNDDTPYILEDWIVDAATMKCIIVHTTENLILNCYRNSVSHPEKKLLLALDHTYRLVHEGHATLVVATIAQDQSAHVIAYATCTDESKIVSHRCSNL
jgi:hypothetical protein